eukprot:CAMPEP_0194396058 /NCGR_PEP_ID=MMETSP0174-20130528/124774_1 /TAXON_ID=216777 /ORGANISM="Proboscia alata, Strain PI-D3" /LENGTH=996 /DNA_ID=CAMNT_0039192075 /DNA_START=186 /DNA_END=3176 /DNA_ORIENTATION=+
MSESTSTNKTDTVEDGIATLSLNTSTSTPELEWPMNKVRQTFINYFQNHPKYPHTFYPSSPVVPHDDPTLLFANAGMNQYKPLFLGTCDPSHPLFSLKRATNSQKCIRAGGKHNDLDDVGKDVYHHTFFEMLGNWSFGDYFKKEAIDLAWNCLTQEFGLDPERLYASYFGGDDATPPDLEARDIWLKYLPAKRVLPFDAADNFWEMGATGPCGPCVEIHYDRIGGRDAADRVNADFPDVIEIWNNVFIQFNREVDGSLRELPNQHVDTGMGFERLTSILQNVDSNYDTDVFLPLFAKIQELTGAPAYSGKIGAEDAAQNYRDMGYRVVADHIRTLCFAISDGAHPSNDGRGYVLRRVLRRAVRYGRQNLGAQLGFFAKLVPTVVELMGGFYPDLVTKQTEVTRVILEEEESFSATIDKGIKLFNDLASRALASSTPTVFSGDDAHKLFTSNGFPVDLTQLMAEEKGLVLDVKRFEEKMAEEKLLSQEDYKRKKAGGSGGKNMAMEAEQTSHLLKTLNVKPTDDAAKFEWDVALTDCRLDAIYLGRGETPDGIGFVDTVTPDSETGELVVGLILNKSSYYAESGGQIYDVGTIVVSGHTVTITSVQSYGGFVLHVGTLNPSSTTALSVGDVGTCHVDYTRRTSIASNHTMTHVLNHGLRKYCISSKNPQIDQKGSYNDDSKLRFDFSYNGPIPPQSLSDVEQYCNTSISQKLAVECKVEKLEDAQQLSTVRAVFGETYPDPVRVVSIANTSISDMLQAPESKEWMEYSVEFCGGTHLSNTSDAQALVIVSEEGIAKGIRRITGITRQAAVDATNRGETLTLLVADAKELTGAALEAEVKRLGAEVTVAIISTVTKTKLKAVLQSYSKTILAWKKEQAAQRVKSILATATAPTTTSNVVCRYDFGTDGKTAKTVMTQYQKQQEKPLLMISADETANRFLVFCVTPKGCAKEQKVNCKAWAAAATEGTNGKGGGKADTAQFTVEGLEKLDGVLEKARAF